MLGGGYSENRNCLLCFKILWASLQNPDCSQCLAKASLFLSSLREPYNSLCNHTHINLPMPIEKSEGGKRNFKWPFREIAVCLHQTLFPNRNYARCLAARSCTYHTFIAATSHIRYQSLLTMGKDRAQWDDIKDLFMIQHLPKPLYKGKRVIAGSKRKFSLSFRETSIRNLESDLLQINFTHGDCDGNFGRQGRKLDIFRD
jgi:hypothetical protein